MSSNNQNNQNNRNKKKSATGKNQNAQPKSSDAQSQKQAKPAGKSQPVQKQRLDELGKQLEQDRAALLTREKVSIDKELELAEREANAEAGFVKQAHQALLVYQDLTADMHEKVAELQQDAKQQLADTFSRHTAQEKQFSEDLQEIVEKAFEPIRLKRAELAARESKLEVAERSLKTAKDSYKTQRQEWELFQLRERATLENEIKAQYQQVITERDKLTAYRERDLERLKSLQNQLCDYKELERELKIKAYSDPQALFTHLDKVEQELKTAQEKLVGHGTEAIESELEQTREEVYQLEEEVDSLRQDNNQMSESLGKHKLSIKEKQMLQQTNDMLECHNQILEAAINSSKTTLGELTEKQQQQHTFTQLCEMDRLYDQPDVPESLASLKGFSLQMQHRMAWVDGTKLYYDLDDVRKFIAGLAMSQLHILQGISGTGKTSLVKAFAEAVGGEITIVPVKAGWRDKDDLIGHYNAFEKRFYESECLQGIYKAQTKQYKNRFNIILLDEMNLSRPEQYFSDLLSALQMHGKGRDLVLMDFAAANPPQKLLEGRKLQLPDNIWFMGTSNDDESTFEFADKTHDRAFVLELARHDIPDGWPTKEKEDCEYSVDSIQKLFEKAINKFYKEAKKCLNKLQKSKFNETLGQHFSSGWGHRFDDQAIRFLCVYKACGGDMANGLEHLLVTRILRKGKVLGRYNSRKEQLEKLSDALDELFKSLDSKPTVASELLTNEILAKEQSVY